MRIVAVKNLTTEMKLARPVYKNGVVLLNSGVSLTPGFKKRLGMMDIKYVYVDDDYSGDIVVDEVIREETKRRSEQALRGIFNKVHMNHDGLLNYEQVKDIVTELMDEIMESDQAQVNMFNIKDYDSYTYLHSINVAVIAILMGKTINLSIDEINRLGEGAIMHDLGKVLLPGEIIKKKQSLTDSEYNIIKEHPRLGYDCLKKEDKMNPVSRIIVLTHHERIDGSGYPAGLQGEEIHLFGRITAIADVFDALTSDRPYRRRWTIRNALDYMTAQADSKFDISLLNAFTRRIAVYPDGITVSLSNGKTALVMRQNDGYPTRPVIRVIEDENGSKLKNPTIIDLLEELELQVVDTL